MQAGRWDRRGMSCEIWIATIRSKAVGPLAPGRYCRRRWNCLCATGARVAAWPCIPAHWDRYLRPGPGQTAAGGGKTDGDHVDDLSAHDGFDIVVMDYAARRMIAIDFGPVSRS
jgi:hypothetical protein